MANMVLRASTDKIGSQSECDLGFTEEEWGDLDEDEQNEIVQETMWNIVNIWTEAV